MRKRKPAKPIPEENKDLVPFGDPRCNLCQLPASDLQYIHRLKFEKNWTHEQIRQYIKAHHDLHDNYTRLVAHFKKHAGEGTKRSLAKKKKKVSAVADVLEKLPKDTRVKTSKEVEAAYDHLVKMSSKFAQGLEKVFGSFEVDDGVIKKIKAKTKDGNPLDFLEQLAKLHKELRDQVKDISALRAPKVMVAQFLENTIEEVIRETSFILSDICSLLQGSLIDELKLKEIDTSKLDSETFAKVFRDSALQFKDRMLALQKTQMSQAMSTLADLEKII